MRRFILLLILATLVQSACTAGANPGPVPSPMDGALPSAAATVTIAKPSTPPGFAGTAAPPAAPTRYRMEISLDYPSHTLTVHQSITYTNRTPGPLEDLVLVVAASNQAGVFMLDEVEAGNGSAIRSWKLADNVLRVIPESLITPGQSFSLNLDYSLQLPETPGKLGIYGGQLNLGDWYPFFPVRDPQNGWLVHPPHGVGETLVQELADFDIRLTIEQAPDGLQVAASAPALQDGDVYRYTAAGYRSFAFSMGERFEVVRRLVGDVEVTSYYFPEHALAGKAALDAAADALEVFTELYGPYPHESYGLVEGNFPDGLEFDGLTIVSEEYYIWYGGTVQDYLVLLSVHEAAHQWFYALVGSDQALEPWLDETLALYSELLYLEARHPDLVDWWWAFRIDPYRPLRGAVNDPVYAHNRFRPYVNAVYLRGADLMRDLRGTMGDEAFFVALRAYADRFRGGFVHAADFRGVIQAFSEEDLGPVWALYFNP